MDWGIIITFTPALNPSSWFCKYSWQKNKFWTKHRTSLLGFSSSSYSLVVGGISNLLLLANTATEAIRCISSNSSTAIADDEEVMLAPFFGHFHAQFSLHCKMTASLAGICFAPRRTNLSIGPVESRSMCALRSQGVRMAEVKSIYIGKMFYPGNEPAFLP